MELRDAVSRKHPELANEVVPRDPSMRVKASAAVQAPPPPTTPPPPAGPPPPIHYPFAEGAPAERAAPPPPPPPQTPPPAPAPATHAPGSSEAEHAPAAAAETAVRRRARSPSGALPTASGGRAAPLGPTPASAGGAPPPPSRAAGIRRASERAQGAAGGDGESGARAARERGEQGSVRRAARVHPRRRRAATASTAATAAGARFPGATPSPRRRLRPESPVSHRGRPPPHRRRRGCAPPRPRLCLRLPPRPSRRRRSRCLRPRPAAAGASARASSDGGAVDAAAPAVMPPPVMPPPPPPAPVPPPQVSQPPMTAFDAAVEGCRRRGARGGDAGVVPLPAARWTPWPGEPVDPNAPKPLCAERLNIVVVASECAPFAKTGGLGDVAAALPKALQRRGHRVMVVMPRYKNYEGAFDTKVRISYNVLGNDTEVGYFHMFKDGIDTVFIDHPAYHAVAGDIYAGDRAEANFRNAMLCQAAIEAVWHVPCGGVPYGDSDLVYMANDWHTSLLPVYLQAYYQDHGKLPFARSVFVIHNMAFQGRGPLDEFYSLGLPEHYKDHFYLDDPFGGECMNAMQAGLRLATKVIAVSAGYAWEITTDMGGWGLAPLLREFGDSKLTGIVNGIDLEEWSPECDPHLDEEGYTRYQPDSSGFEGKAQCKRALQKQLGLPERDDVPLLGFIGRLDHQKGVDLITGAAGWLMNQGAAHHARVGRADLEESLRSMENAHGDKCKCWVGFSVEMAHRITAGCDILLMPSRFEPCGLNQLYAMRYGTPSVARRRRPARDRDALQPPRRQRYWVAVRRGGDPKTHRSARVRHRDVQE